MRPARKKPSSTRAHSSASSSARRRPGQGFGRHAPCGAHRRRRSGRLTHQCAGVHHPRRGVGRVAHRSATPRKQQVLHAGVVQASQRQAVARHRKLAVLLLFTQHPAGGVTVHVPAAIGHRAGPSEAARHVALGQRLLPHQPARAAPSGIEAQPFQLQILRVIAAAVFDVVPDAQGDRAQLQPDALVLGDHIQLAAVLKPPAVAALHVGPHHAPAPVHKLPDALQRVGVVRRGVGRGMVQPPGL